MIKRIYKDLHQACFYIASAINLKLEDENLQKEYYNVLDTLVTNKNVIDPWDEHLCNFYSSVKINENEFIKKKKKVIKLLSEIPSVKTVSTYKKPVLQNNINIGYVQKNKQAFVRDEYSKLYIYDRYVHKHNLTGEGQIITIVDSPIDFRHPMFHDEKVEIEFNKDMPNHRKFLYFHRVYNEITFL